MKLYESKSASPKRDAQNNMRDRTHYADDDMLRFFYARITATKVLCGGLVYAITESVAVDHENKRRGKRCVCFDVLGDVIYCPGLEDTFATSCKAQRHMRAFIETFDANAHTLQALRRRKRQQIEQHAEDIAQLRGLGSAANCDSE